MRTHYRPAIFLLTAALFVVNGGRCTAQGQGQPGGGSLPGDAVGGAALIFHKPENPPLHKASGSSSGAAGGGRVSAGGSGVSGGGGRVSGSAKSRTAAAAQERVIAKANAARSAPTPRYSEAEQQYKLAATQDPNDARAHAGLGNIYLDQGRFNDAVEAYRRALGVYLR